MRSRLLAALLAFTMGVSMSAVQASAVSPVVCTHEVVSADGVCENENCNAQALAKFMSEGTTEFFFTANDLGWKTINMNNNGTDDTYTITILNDIPSMSFTILADTVTIDLNGFEIGYTDGDFGNIVYLDESGNLTITDSSDSKTGAMINPTGPVVDFSRNPNAESAAVLNIEAGTFSGSGITFWLGGGTLYIKGGTVIGQYIAAAGAITGGRFTLDPSGDLTEEYEAVLEDDYYVVREKSAQVTVPIVNSGDGKSVEVSAVVSGDKAAVTDVDLSELDAVIGDETAAGNIIIDFSALDALLAEVEIPADTVNKISEAVIDGSNSFEIVFAENVSIEFDGDALAAIVDQADDESITVSIEAADAETATNAQIAVIGDRPAYDITVKSGDTNISDMGGKIIISAPYELGANEDPDGVAVYYVDENGGREKCETVYNSESQRVSWVTTHLSVYMVDYKESSHSNPGDVYWLLMLVMMKNQKLDIFAATSEGGSVAPEGTTQVKYASDIVYTITPSEGYVVSDVLVDGKSVGAVNEYTFAKVTEAHTIHAVFEKLPAENAFFTDVNEGDWYFEDVKFVSENGLMVGTTDDGTVFSPDGTLTRAMLVTMLWRMAGCPTIEADIPYSDVSADTWYSEAVRWASFTDIILGYGDGSFGPEDILTREQLAVILYRYEQHNGGGFKGMWMFRLDYSDVSDVSDWAYEAFCFMTMHDIYVVRENEQLAPRENALRAETAAVLHRYALNGKTE